MNEHVAMAREMLARAGVAPDAWKSLRLWMKRSVIARALDTDDSRVVDSGVELADWAFARATGFLTGAVDENTPPWVSAAMLIAVPAVVLGLVAVTSNLAAPMPRKSRRHW